MAVISKFKIANTKTLAIPRDKSETKHKRPILQVTLDIEGRPLTILVNHWKSKGGGKKGSESKRIEYAKVARQSTRRNWCQRWMLLHSATLTRNTMKKIRLLLPGATNNDSDGQTGINDYLLSISDEDACRNANQSQGFQYTISWYELPESRRRTAYLREFLAVGSLSIK